MLIPLHAAMVSSSLAATIVHAGSDYCRQPGKYARMPANCYDKARSFSWERAAEEFSAWYDLATE